MLDTQRVSKHADRIMSMHDQFHSLADRLMRLPPFLAIAQRQARLAFIANRDQNMFLGVFES